MVSVPGIGVPVQWLGLSIGKWLGQHHAGDILRVLLEVDGIGVLLPLGVQVNGPVFDRGQVQDGLLVTVGNAGSVRAGVPSRKGGSGLPVAAHGQFLFGSAVEGLVFHGPGHILSVGVELHGVGIGLPLGVQADHRSVLFG